MTTTDSINYCFVFGVDIQTGQKGAERKSKSKKEITALDTNYFKCDHLIEFFLGWFVMHKQSQNKALYAVDGVFALV